MVQFLLDRRPALGPARKEHRLPLRFRLPWRSISAKVRPFSGSQSKPMLQGVTLWHFAQFVALKQQMVLQFVRPTRGQRQLDPSRPRRAE